MQKKFSGQDYAVMLRFNFASDKISGKRVRSMKNVTPAGFQPQTINLMGSVTKSYADYNRVIA